MACADSSGIIAPRPLYNSSWYHTHSTGPKHTSYHALYQRDTALAFGVFAGRLVRHKIFRIEVDDVKREKLCLVTIVPGHRITSPQQTVDELPLYPSVAIFKVRNIRQAYPSESEDSIYQNDIR